MKPTLISTLAAVAFLFTGAATADTDAQPGTTSDRDSDTHRDIDTYAQRTLAEGSV